MPAFYQDQGRYSEAEPFYKRSLSIREKALGPDHPYVGTSVGALALMYHLRGNYADNWVIGTKRPFVYG